MYQTATPVSTNYELCTKYKNIIVLKPFESNQKQEEVHLMKDRSHTEWGPHLSSFFFMGTLSPLAWHIEFKQKAAVLGSGVKRSQFGAARVAGYEIGKSQKGGNHKRRCPNNLHTSSP